MMKTISIVGFITILINLSCILKGQGDQTQALLNELQTAAIKECNCYKEALIQPDRELSLRLGLNCNYSFMEFLMKHNNYFINREKQLEFEIASFRKYATYFQNCPTLDSFYMMLNIERDVEPSLINSDSYLPLEGEYTVLDLKENMIFKIDGKKSTTYYLDINRTAIYRYKRISNNEFYMIFEESDNPLLFWMSKGDTTLVRIIDKQEDTLYYDMIRKTSVVPQRAIKNK